ncbi:hypothetical protein [Phycicoccus flavus]|uniref:hypothetical protein n=1 Tax=Phycicoccus flavus TaxID=2502783 RepID=UPI000FEC11CD|nr:hypothetical protein [Phycicoccus flavus]NHA70015.1 hypothetical protein [Phycicoccus flavus]
MNHPHDDRDPIEHDPTGMRALLGSLPDPAPMPADLVERISAALADEVRVRDGWAAPDCPPELRADDDGSRVGMAAPGPSGVGAAAASPGAPGRGRSSSDPTPGTVLPLRRRSGLRALAAAAAVVGVLGAAGLVVETTRPGGLQAALGIAGTDGGSASDESAAGGATSDAGGAGPASPQVLAADASLGVEVYADGGSLTAAQLGDHAAALPVVLPDGVAAAGPEPSGAPAPTTDAAARKARVADPAAARACATALGVPADAGVAVQLALVDDTRAAVVVATSSDGARTAWAVARGCRPGAPQVLAGPVRVP